MLRFHFTYDPCTKRQLNFDEITTPIKETEDFRLKQETSQRQS